MIVIKWSLTAGKRKPLTWKYWHDCGNLQEWNAELNNHSTSKSIFLNLQQGWGLLARWNRTIRSFNHSSYGDDASSVTNKIRREKLIRNSCQWIRNGHFCTVWYVTSSNHYCDPAVGVEFGSSIPPNYHACLAHSCGTIELSMLVPFHSRSPEVPLILTTSTRAIVPVSLPWQPGLSQSHILVLVHSTEDAGCNVYSRKHWSR